MEMTWRVSDEENMNGGTVTFPGPVRTPATRWYGFREAGIVRCGRVSLKEGSARRDLRSGWEVMKASASNSTGCWWWWWLCSSYPTDEMA